MQLNTNQTTKPEHNKLFRVSESLKLNLLSN